MREDDEMSTWSERENYRFNPWKYAFIGAISAMVALAFGFVTASVFWYG